MINRANTIAVTRKEFYIALSALWLYVSFAFKPGVLQPWMSYLLWGCALATSVSYAVLGFRSRKTKHTDDVTA